MPSVTDDIVSIGEIPLKFEPLRQKGTLGIGAHMSWKYFYSHRSHYEAYQSSPFLPLSILIFLFHPRVHVYHKAGSMKNYKLTKRYSVLPWVLSLLCWQEHRADSPWLQSLRMSSTWHQGLTFSHQSPLMYFKPKSLNIKLSGTTWLWCTLWI